MGTFDDLFLKAKELARTAGNKTEEMVELTRLKMQASQLRGEIDANYQKLGEITFELTRAGAENAELINMCITEIESQLAELDQMNDKINQMRNVVKCPACMGTNPVGAAYCARCGASLKGQPATSAEPDND